MYNVSTVGGDTQGMPCLGILVTTEGNPHPIPKSVVSQDYFLYLEKPTKITDINIHKRKKNNGYLTLYLKPSTGTISTSKMYLAHGIRPARLILQCGNILLEDTEEDT